MAKKPSSSQKARYLKVPNAPTVEQFKIEAERVWKEAHTPKRRGRPTHMQTVWNILHAGLTEEKITAETSLNKLVLFGKERLGTYPHEETIRKYAKVWKIMQKRSLNRVKPAEANWIEEHAPDAWLIFQKERMEEEGRFNDQMSFYTTAIKEFTDLEETVHINKKFFEGFNQRSTNELANKTRSDAEREHNELVNNIRGNIESFNNKIAALKKWWNGPD